MAAWPHGSHRCCSYGIAMVSQAHTLLDSSPDKQAHFIFPLKKKKRRRRSTVLLFFVSFLPSLSFSWQEGAVIPCKEAPAPG